MGPGKTDRQWRDEWSGGDDMVGRGEEGRTGERSGGEGSRVECTSRARR
jgi:hypothetical protein